VQEGRKHAKKGERREEGTEGWGWDEGVRGGRGRENVDKTSSIVAVSENVQLVVRVLHVLHRAVIGRQTRTKRLATRQCAAHESGLRVSDASLQLILRNLEKSLVGNLMEILPPGNQLHRLLR